jgi:uncharacterized membrane protein YfhO
MGQKRNPPKLYVFDGISRFSEVVNESIFKKLTDLDFLTNPVSFTYQDLQGLTSLNQCLTWEDLLQLRRFCCFPYSETFLTSKLG